MLEHLGGKRARHCECEVRQTGRLVYVALYYAISESEYLGGVSCGVPGWLVERERLVRPANPTRKWVIRWVTVRITRGNPYAYCILLVSYVNMLVILIVFFDWFTFS